MLSELIDGSIADGKDRDPIDAINTVVSCRIRAQDVQVELTAWRQYVPYLARDVIYPAATDIRDTRDTRAGQTVVIVVGSSSHATHHMAGSVPVSLTRYSPCSS